MKKSPIYFDQARIQTLQLLLSERFDELFAEFDVSFRKTRKMYVGACPIHGGSNQSALNFYHDGDVPGKWVCNTKHCEHFFKRTTIGFVRGMLSNRDYGWVSPDSPRSASFPAAVDWCCRFIGQNFADIHVDQEAFEKKSFATNTSVFAKYARVQKTTITRAHVRQRLNIPAKYLVDRGWSPEILNKYDVGLCTDPSKPFFERVVVPIYDENYTSCIGFTGRTIHPVCEKCQQFHKPGPCPPPSADTCKWKNSEGLARESCLFNFWFAKQAIKQSGTVYLCEGPGDVFRLVEAGIPNAVAILGTSLTDQQQCILETSGAQNVVVLTNMDQAGREAAQRILKKLERLYRVRVPVLPKKDLGEIPINEVKKVLGANL